MRQLNYLAFVLNVLLLPGLTCADWLRDEATIMGTAVNVELWHDDEQQGRSVIHAVMNEMRRIDQLMSSYKTESELSRINADAATEAVIVGNELFSLIEQALRYSEITDGAFDITYASAGQYYDYRNSKKPDGQQLAATLPAISYRHVIMNKTHSSVRFSQPGVRIDLGGIAKGYAVDRCIAILQAAGISNALVTAGGDTRVIGRHWEHPWMIGVRDPRKHDGIITRIPLEDAAISTSGDYERYFEQDGVRYHHILNPGTGDSPREVHSTTIIGTTATHTDALSTSVFVLGVKKGLALINTLPDTEAIIIDNQGIMHYSDGLMQLER